MDIDDSRISEGAHNAGLEAETEAKAVDQGEIVKGQESQDQHHHEPYQQQHEPDHEQQHDLRSQILFQSQVAPQASQAPSQHTMLPPVNQAPPQQQAALAKPDPAPPHDVVPVQASPILPQSQQAMHAQANPAPLPQQPMPPQPEYQQHKQQHSRNYALTQMEVQDLCAEATRARSKAYCMYLAAVPIPMASDHAMPMSPKQQY